MCNIWLVGSWFWWASGWILWRCGEAAERIDESSRISLKHISHACLLFNSFSFKLKDLYCAVLVHRKSSMQAFIVKHLQELLYFRTGPAVRVGDTLSLCHTWPACFSLFVLSLCEGRENLSDRKVERATQRRIQLSSTTQKLNWAHVRLYCRKTLQLFFYKYMKW